MSGFIGRLAAAFVGFITSGLSVTSILYINCDNHISFFNIQANSVTAPPGRCQVLLSLLDVQVDVALALCNRHEFFDLSLFQSRDQMNV